MAGSVKTLPEFSTYQSTLAHLWKTARPGMRMSLEPIKAVLSSLGNPQKEYPCVLTAGTNGKGSTCSMLSEILARSGMRVGLYTSPHLNHYGERIILKDRGGPAHAPEEMWRENYSRLARAVERLHLPLTQFEILTALAFLVFRETAVDVAVLEAGMGGRLDAANACDPILSIITPIALDHENYLGHTLGEIAGEKAGILRTNIPALTLQGSQEAQAALREIAIRRGVPLQFVFPGELVEFSPESQTFIYGGKTYHQKLLGLHQVGNACLAIDAARILNELKFSISEKAIEAGIRQARWPARFEIAHRDPFIIIDSAHNPHGTLALIETLNRWNFPRPRLVLAGFLDDKDVQRMLPALSSWGDQLVFCHSRSPRAVPSPEILKMASALNLSRPCLSAGRVGEGVKKSIQMLENGGTLCISGSITVAGEARRLLVKKVCA